MIGILQGRLTKPWNGQLQCFPRGAWEAEFELVREAGFDALEPFVETEHNPDNPVWSDSGMGVLRALSAEFGVGTRVLCADCFMTTTFVQQPSAALGLLARLGGKGFELLVLPFFEKAELKAAADGDKLASTLRLSPVPPSQLALETTLPAADLIPLVDRLGAKVCYDLGNTTALGHDIARDIRLLGRRIVHVHIKDKRRSDGQNVLLGTGDTDFAGAAVALRDIDYRGDFTCETFRGDDPLETARRHRAFVGRWWGEGR